MILWCAHAGETWLDRSLCSEPCNAMHLRCGRCGAALGGCPFERADVHERMVGLVQAAVHGDELEALGIVGAVERASRLGVPVSLAAARRAVS